MAIPTSRETLKDYCLRELGAPVLEINVDDDQLEDRIDQALDFWRLYHYDGIEKVYLKHQIAAGSLEITGTNAASFGIGDIVTGATSGAKAKIYTGSDTNTLKIARVTGTFIASENISDTQGHTATLAATNFYTPSDLENGYVPIADSVYGIIRVLPLFSSQSSSRNIFDLQYQLRLNDLYDLASTSIIYYTTVMQHLATLDLVLNGRPIYRFNRLQNRLFLDIDWKDANKVDIGQFLIIEAYRALDPNEFTRVWNEQWLKKYVTAQFKRQWATNIKKFSGIQLPGGVTLDGDKLYDEAKSEIEDLENDLQNKSAPLDFFMG